MCRGRWHTPEQLFCNVCRCYRCGAVERTARRETHEVNWQENALEKSTRSWKDIANLPLFQTVQTLYEFAGCMLKYSIHRVRGNIRSAPAEHTGLQISNSKRHIPHTLVILANNLKRSKPVELVQRRVRASDHMRAKWRTEERERQARVATQ